MRIALVAPLDEAVPPPMYGGTERVIATLANELVDRGHDVTLFAAATSDTRARLVPCAPEPLRTSMTREERMLVSSHLHLAMLSKVYERANEFDIIHAHTDVWTLPFIGHSATPTVVTMHGRLDFETPRAVLPLYPDAPLVSISDSQRDAVADFDLRWVSTCYNGLDLSRYHHASATTTPGDHLAFVGRITAEKRPDWAIEVARRAGRLLVIAAKIDPMDQEYWDDYIGPLVAASDHVEFIGEISEADKPDFFAGAAATLFPVDWPEPFGLVMIESMAAGTPVIALDNGAVPEVLADGVSGRLCTNLDDMVKAVHTIYQFDRDLVADSAKRFSGAAMANAYLATYRDLIADTDDRRVIHLPNTTELTKPPPPNIRPAHTSNEPTAAVS